MRVLVLTLLTFKKVKLIFGHPVLAILGGLRLPTFFVAIPQDI